VAAQITVTSYLILNFLFADCNSDWIFVLDGSGSIDSFEFQLMKNFVVDISSAIEIGHQKNLVAVISYGNNPILHFNLNRYTYKPSLLQAIRAIQRNSGGTNTAAALQLLRGRSLGLRSGCRHIAIVLTDGGSNNKAETSRVASSLHSAYHVVAVGVGSPNLNELQSIASKAEYVFSRSTFNAATLQTYKTKILSLFNNPGMYIIVYM